MKKEQQLREAIRSIFKEKKTNLVDTIIDIASNTDEEGIKILSKLILNDNLKGLDLEDGWGELIARMQKILDESPLKEVEKIYDLLKNEGLIREDIDPDFLDKVETRKEEEIIETLTDINLQLTDVQKYILKFRPKLIDELAKAKAILEEIQNKLSNESMIGENKLNKVIKEILTEFKLKIK